MGRIGMDVDCYNALIDAERELSHLLSDMGTYSLPVNDIGRRILTIRDVLRAKIAYVGRSFNETIKPADALGSLPHLIGDTARKPWR